MVTKRVTTKKKSNAKRAPQKSRGLLLMKKTRTLLTRLFIIAAAALFCYLIYIYVVAPYSAKWRALYGKEDYPKGYSIHGIDISHHQGSIDWEKLSKAEIDGEGICFVFIKATEGRSLLDENFNENFYKAREYGFLRGAYHYFKPNVSAKKQAEYFLKQVHLEEGDLPPVLDIEERGRLSAAELREASLTWLRAVEERYHVKPILYTSYKFRLDVLNTKEFDAYPYWIAHYYVKDLSYKGEWKFWQHTDCGKLAGINHKVDLNIYNGSMYDLRRLCIEYQGEKR
ncbi:MAG: glycoside hydrolase family 25 protein [Bacteroidales bacterium]|nr:glycoside hydrolase family 25 protein [Bacteroidales bacterium]